MLRLVPSAVLGAVFCLCGCVSTHVEGQRLVAEPTSYRRIVVFCDVDEEPLREEVEEAVAESLTEGPVVAEMSLNVLDEPRVYGPEEVKAALEAGGWEATLVVILDEYVTEVIGYPGTVSAGVTPYGGAVFLTPPVEYDRSSLRIRLEVFDRNADEPVWVGDALAHSSQVHSLEGLASEVARKVRGLLQEQGVLFSRRVEKR